VFVKGDVLKTLAVPENLPPKICVLRLDTDWYESTKLEFETLYPRLSIGGVIVVAAGLGLSTEHALISLLALNGLRVSEATGADIEHLAWSAATGP
jgi:hypothetical protein